jgi:polysaccharide chain length determinant protein (PEP-CTERM system associated)
MPKAPELSPLNWHDYLAIAVRRRWVLMAPFFALGLAGCVLALVWPMRYRSEALILVEQPKVAEQYVTPNVEVDLQGRLESMTEQILSRARLQDLIAQLNLYPRERRGMTAAALVDMMRKDITIEPDKGSPQTGELQSFRIAYTAPHREVAQQVVSKLTSLFIDENLRARDQQSTDTTQFLENQLADARKDLDKAEERLRDYKMQYLGELPEQEQSNLQILSSLEAQLNASSTELDRLQQDKTYLESMKAGYKALGPTTNSHPIDPDAEALRALRAKLADLQSRYTDRYPEVIRTKEEIARREAIQKQKGAAGNNSLKAPGAEASLTDTPQPGLIEIDSRLKAVRVDIENRRQEIDALRGKIQTAQAHLNLTPVREQQLAEVTRDYENAKAQYQSLLQKESQSELATNLEKRQQGDQFRIIDPASLPDKPVDPNRAEIIMGGWLLGLMAGIGLAALKEAIDTKVHGEADLKTVSCLPILVSIPDLSSPREQAAVKRRHWLEALMACLLVATSLGLEAYLHYWVK